MSQISIELEEILLLYKIIQESSHLTEFSTIHRFQDPNVKTRI